MGSVFRNATAFAVVGSSALVIVAAACSDDEAAPASNDAGVPDSPIVVPDSAIVDPCADAGSPQRTCTAAQCTAQLGEPAVCVDDACVKLKSDECQTTIGPIDDDNAIILGQLTNTRGSDQASGTGRTRSLQLALEEINATAGGVYTADGCGRRPLALVVCDDSNSPKEEPDAGNYDRRAAATHLATELKVPVIFGPHNSNNTIDIVTNVTSAARTTVLVPTAGAAEITNVDGGNVDGARIVWRMIPSDALQAKAVYRIGEKTEADIRAANPGKTTLKIAIVNRGDAFGRGLRDGVKAEVTHNGLSWANNDPGNVLELEYATGVPVPDSIADELITFQPDIVYFFGLGEIFNPVLGRYEDLAAASGGTATLPYWITSASGERNELLATIADGRPQLRTRVRGSSSVLLTPLAQAFFNLGYKAAYPDTKELVFGMTQSYDSAYLAAYALTQTQPTLTTQISSMDFAKAMEKMTGGTLKVDVGTAKLKEGLEASRKGEAIDFNGACGPLDFDPAVGEAPGDYTVWCVRNDPNDGKPIFENATGMKWNFVTNALEGTFECP